MRLDTRARAVGRKTGEHTWIVALRNLVSDAPSGLGEVEVEVDRVGTLLVTLTPDLLSEVRTEWWRDLEAQVNALPSHGDPQEAELLAAVISRLPWHPRKQRILRRLDDQGAEVVVPRRAPEPVNRWAEPKRSRADAR